MSTRQYCGAHSIHYSSRNCPRCEAKERHEALLRATQESAEETACALRDLEYRVANPGQYECPHCKYVSLRSDASRCPLCHGEVSNGYWDRVRAEERKADEQRRLEVKARRVEREAQLVVERQAARVAAIATEKRVADLRVQRFFICGAGVVAGGIAGAIAAIIVGLPVILISAAFGNEDAAEPILTGVAVCVAVLGGIIGYSIGSQRIEEALSGQPPR